MPWENLRLITASGESFVTADDKDFYTADKVYTAGDDAWSYRPYIKVYPVSASKSLSLIHI